MEYKMLGVRRIIMKKECIPSVFAAQSDHRTGDEPMSPMELKKEPDEGIDEPESALYKQSGASGEFD